MGMPGQGMATAGAPVKERDQKGPTVANGAGKGWDVRRKDRAPSRGHGLEVCGGQGLTQGFVTRGPGPGSLRGLTMGV